MEEDELLTVPEAAQALGVSQGAVRIAMYEGRLPFQTVVGRKVVLKSDLDAYRLRSQPEGGKRVGRPRKQADA